MLARVGVSAASIAHATWLDDRLAGQIPQQIDEMAGLADDAAPTHLRILRPVVVGMAPALTVITKAFGPGARRASALILMNLRREAAIEADHQQLASAPWRMPPLDSRSSSSVRLAASRRRRACRGQRARHVLGVAVVARGDDNHIGVDIAEQGRRCRWSPRRNRISCPDERCSTPPADATLRRSGAGGLECGNQHRACVVAGTDDAYARHVQLAWCNCAGGQRHRASLVRRAGIGARRPRVLQQDPQRRFAACNDCVGSLSLVDVESDARPAAPRRAGPRPACPARPRSCAARSSARSRPDSPGPSLRSSGRSAPARTSSDTWKVSSFS